MNQPPASTTPNPNMPHGAKLAPSQEGLPGPGWVRIITEHGLEQMIGPPADLQSHLTHDAEYDRILARLRELPQSAETLDAREAVMTVKSVNLARAKRIVHEWPELHDKAVRAVQIAAAKHAPAAAAAAPTAVFADVPVALTPMAPVALPAAETMAERKDYRHLRPSLLQWGPNMRAVLEFFFRGSVGGPGFTLQHLIDLAPPAEEVQIRAAVTELVTDGFVSVVQRGADAYFVLSELELARMAGPVIAKAVAQAVAQFQAAQVQPALEPGAVT